MRRQLILAAAAVVAVAVALAVSQGDDDNRTGAGGADTSGGSTSRQPGDAGDAGDPNRPAPAKKRDKGDQGLRRGHGQTPDAPAPGTDALLAIADQKPETFSDPEFQRLGVARSRLNAPWNAALTEPDRLGAWLNAARSAGIEPLVAFEHARGEACPADPCSLPSVRDYTRAMKAFHRRWPWVRLLTSWNEANSSTQPTGTRPARAAAYYEALRGVCPSCIVTGADVLDGSNMERWLAAFRNALDGPTPQLWGLHNYGDINHFRSDGTRRMLKLVPGQIWFTEAGGIVYFRTADGRVAFPYDERRAARATRYLFRLASLSPRIKRVYIYQWKIDFPGNRFDAGLVGPDGRPRPALRVVLQHRALLR